MKETQELHYDIISCVATPLLVHYSQLTLHLVYIIWYFLVMDVWSQCNSLKKLDL